MTSNHDCDLDLDVEVTYTSATGDALNGNSVTVELGRCTECGQTFTRGRLVLGAGDHHGETTVTEWQPIDFPDPSTN